MAASFFPISPELNQVFTHAASGTMWRWNGTQWLWVGGPQTEEVVPPPPIEVVDYLPLTGGHIEGNLSVEGQLVGFGNASVNGDMIVNGTLDVYGPVRFADFQLINDATQPMQPVSLRQFNGLLDPLRDEIAGIDVSAQIGAALDALKQDAGAPWLRLAGGTLTGSVKFQAGAFTLGMDLGYLGIFHTSSFNGFWISNNKALIESPNVEIWASSGLTVARMGSAGAIFYVPTTFTSATFSNAVTFNAAATFNQRITYTYDLGNWHGTLGWRLFSNWTGLSVAGRITIAGTSIHDLANIPTGWVIGADDSAGTLRWLRSGQPWHQLIMANNQIRLESENVDLPLFQISATGASFNVLLNIRNLISGTALNIEVEPHVAALIYAKRSDQPAFFRVGWSGGVEAPAVTVSGTNDVNNSIAIYGYYIRRRQSNFGWVDMIVGDGHFRIDNEAYPYPYSPLWVTSDGRVQMHNPTTFVARATGGNVVEINGRAGSSNTLSVHGSARQYNLLVADDGRVFFGYGPSAAIITPNAATFNVFTDFMASAGGLPIARFAQDVQARRYFMVGSNAAYNDAFFWVHNDGANFNVPVTFNQRITSTYNLTVDGASLFKEPVTIESSNVYFLLRIGPVGNPNTWQVFQDGSTTQWGDFRSYADIKLQANYGKGNLTVEGAATFNGPLKISSNEIWPFQIEASPGVPLFGVGRHPDGRTLVSIYGNPYATLGCDSINVDREMVVAGGFYVYNADYSVLLARLSGPTSFFDASIDFKQRPTMSAGLSFGTATASTATNVSRHLDLYGGTYGLAITANAFNLCAAGGFYFRLGAVTPFTVTSSWLVSAFHHYFDGPLTVRNNQVVTLARDAVAELEAVPLRQLNQRLIGAEAPRVILVASEQDALTQSQLAPNDFFVWGD